MEAVSVVDGVWVLRSPPANWVLVADEGGVLAIDAGMPAAWDQLQRALGEIGRTPGELRGLVLTHGHLDHTGFAARAQAELGVTVWAHPQDHALAAAPLRPTRTERLTPLYMVNASAREGLRQMLAGGARHAQGVTGLSALVPGEPLSQLPGAPVAVFTPGHTPGHCSILLPNHDVLVAGDALVTHDPYTGATGPRLMARGSTWSSADAGRSLGTLAEVQAQWLVPGHGEVWDGGVARAAELARREVQG